MTNLLRKKKRKLKTHKKKMLRRKKKETEKHLNTSKIPILLTRDKLLNKLKTKAHLDITTPK